MHRSFRVVLSAVVACWMLLAFPACVRAAKLDAEEQAFVTLINRYRRQHGLRPLTISNTLDASAVWMSRDMATKRYFSHTDSRGRTFDVRLRAFGYRRYTTMGENIAAGGTTAKEVFRLWKQSPSHNANMLKANYRVMGIARVKSVRRPYRWYWTNDFGG